MSLLSEWGRVSGCKEANVKKKAALKERDRGELMYIAIDLKSFYASVEAIELGLDPLTTNLVVADVSRTEKTICLA